MTSWLFSTHSGLAAPERPVSPILPDDAPLDDQVNAWGYGHREMLFGIGDGNSEGIEAEVHARAVDTAPGAYLVLVGIGETTEAVHVADFPSLLRFLSELEPLLQLTIRVGDQRSLHTHLIGCGRHSQNKACISCRQEMR